MRGKNIIICFETMEKKQRQEDKIKIVFSLISLFLMIPPLLECDSSYYRTLFVFLINRVIDMSFGKDESDSTFLVIWALFNQWLGVLACAVAFCSIAPDFAKIINEFSNKVNIALFVAALSCVLREMTKLIIVSAKEALIKDVIKKDVNGMEGKMIWQELK